MLIGTPFFCVLTPVTEHMVLLLAEARTALQLDNASSPASMVVFEELGDVVRLLAAVAIGAEGKSACTIGKARNERR